MAASTSTSSHARSNSWPCSSSHPLLLSVEQHLDRLRSSSEGKSSSCSTQNSLDGLKNLYECLEDVLELPRISLSHDIIDNDVLDGSLRLLDICGTVRDIYTQLKEIIQELESSLRRRKRGDFEMISHKINAYLISRKRLNKTICKCYKELKKAAAKKKDCEKRQMPLVHLMIKEAQEVSFSMLKSTLFFISDNQPKSVSTLSRLLLKTNKKSFSCEGESSDFADGIYQKLQEIDELLLLFLNKANNQEKEDHQPQVQNLQKGLQTIDLSIQELVQGLEVLFRVLLKSRVSLLNILNH